MRWVLWDVCIWLRAVRFVDNSLCWPMTRGHRWILFGLPIPPIPCRAKYICFWVFAQLPQTTNHIHQSILLDNPHSNHVRIMCDVVHDDMVKVMNISQSPVDAFCAQPKDVSVVVPSDEVIAGNLDEVRHGSPKWGEWIYRQINTCYSIYTVYIYKCSVGVRYISPYRIHADTIAFVWPSETHHKYHSFILGRLTRIYALTITAFHTTCTVNTNKISYTMA